MKFVNQIKKIHLIQRTRKSFFRISKFDFTAQIYRIKFENWTNFGNISFFIHKIFPCWNHITMLDHKFCQLFLFWFGWRFILLTLSTDVRMNLSISQYNCEQMIATLFHSMPFNWKTPVGYLMFLFFLDFQQCYP